jgi:hypothetical protein
MSGKPNLDALYSIQTKVDALKQYIDDKTRQKTQQMQQMEENIKKVSILLPKGKTIDSIVKDLSNNLPKDIDNNLAKILIHIDYFDEPDKSHIDTAIGPILSELREFRYHAKVLIHSEIPQLQELQHDPNFDRVREGFWFWKPKDTTHALYKSPSPYDNAPLFRLGDLGVAGHLVVRNRKDGAGHFWNYYYLQPSENATGSYAAEQYTVKNPSKPRMLHDSSVDISGLQEIVVHDNPRHDRFVDGHWRWKQKDGQGFYKSVYTPTSNPHDGDKLFLVNSVLAGHLVVKKQKHDNGYSYDHYYIRPIELKTTD